MSSIEKLSCREKMKEELSLTKKSYNSVWGLSLSADFPPSPPAQWLWLLLFQDQQCHQALRETMGRKKKN